MAKKMSKRKAEESANEIIDVLAELERLLYKAGKSTLIAIKPKLMAIEAVQCFGFDAKEPENHYHWWSLNTVDFIKIIRDTFFDDLDWSDDDVREMFGKPNPCTKD